MEEFASVAVCISLSFVIICIFGKQENIRTSVCSRYDHTVTLPVHFLEDGHRMQFRKQEL